MSNCLTIRQSTSYKKQFIGPSTMARWSILTLYALGPCMGKYSYFISVRCYCHNLIRDISLLHEQLQHIFCKHKFCHRFYGLPVFCCIVHGIGIIFPPF